MILQRKQVFFGDCGRRNWFNFYILESSLVLMEHYSFLFIYVIFFLNLDYLFC